MLSPAASLLWLSFMCRRLEDRVLYPHLPPKPQNYVKFLSRLRKLQIPGT